MNKIMILGALGLCLGALAGCAQVGCATKTSEKPSEAQMARIDRVLNGYYKEPNLGEVIELTPLIAAIMTDSGTAPIGGFYYGLATVAGANGERLRKAAEIHPKLAACVEKGLKQDRGIFDAPLEDYSPGLLDFYWGYFLATGDRTVVMKIVKRGAMKVPATCTTLDMTAAAARWSAKSLAKTHPVVQGAIDEFLAQATEAEKDEFEQRKKDEPQK